MKFAVEKETSMKTTIYKIASPAGHVNLLEQFSYDGLDVDPGIVYLPTYVGRCQAPVLSAETL